MLENSLWQRYNETKTIRETLSAIYGCDAVEIGDDEGALYASLKRHLTKKELKLFIMNEAGIAQDEITGAVGIDNEAYELAKHKTYRKIKQDKIYSEVKTLRTNQSE